jgi:hypothetical protein
MLWFLKQTSTDLTNILRNVGFDVLTAVVMKSSIFWDITPCNPLRINRRFGGTCRLHIQGRMWQAELCFPPAFTLVSCLACSLTLKTEVTCSSKTSVDFKWTTWLYIPEDRTLHSKECVLRNVLGCAENYICCNTFLIITVWKFFSVL